MSRSAMFVIGLLGALLVFAAACNGTPTPDLRVTKVTVEVPNERTCPTGPAAVSTTTVTTVPTELEISVKGNNLQFEKDKLEVAAGSEVAVAFNNASTAFQHNWVLVKSGTKNDVVKRGSKCSENGWVQPGDPDVIAHTRLLNPGQSGQVGFVAPPPGNYEFVCTFPGHNTGGMSGEFVVIP